MIISKAEISDFLDIAALDRIAWGQNRNAEFIPDGEHVWRLWVEHAYVYVCKNDEGKLIGAILGFPSLSKVFCIHKVFVDPSCRGMGIGSKLFKVLLVQIDHEKADSFLTVDPVNEHAIALYEKWGFSERKFVKGYYRAAEDRFVLTRPAKVG